MGGVQSFKDLIIRQKSHQLSMDIYTLYANRLSDFKKEIAYNLSTIRYLTKR